MSEPGKFQLVNLEGAGSFVFKFFPSTNRSDDRANWEAQDTTIGTKPLFYANREPRRLTFDELWLDVSDGFAAFDSITEDLKSLRALQTESRKTGAPPALLAIWGDRQERVVLEQLTVEEQFPFARNGNPMRAKVSLQLLELQQDEEVDVTIDQSGDFSGP
jgi:hypothetical protein